MQSSASKSRFPYGCSQIGRAIRKKGAYHSKAMKAVTAPSVEQDPYAAQPVGALDASLTANGDTAFICPLFL